MYDFKIKGHVIRSGKIRGKIRGHVTDFKKLDHVPDFRLFVLNPAKKKRNL